MSRQLLLLLGVLVVAAAASLLWRPSGGRAAVPPRRADAAAVVEAGPNTPSPPARQPTAPPEELEASTEPALEPVSSAPEQDGALVTLHGNVTVTDPQGVRHGAEDGQLALEVLRSCRLPGCRVRRDQ